MATRPWRARLAGIVLGALLLALASALPDGAAPSDGLLVFDSDRGGQLDIWTMRPDGSDLRKLTDDKTDDAFPQWSPSGKKIAFTSTRDGDAEIPTRTDGSRTASAVCGSTCAR